MKDSGIPLCDEVPLVEWQNRRTPEPGDIYRHTKSGTFYKVTAFGHNANNSASTNGDPMIAYHALGASDQVWFRDIEEFLGIGSNNTYRFVMWAEVDPNKEQS